MQSSYLSFQSAEITDTHHQAWHDILLQKSDIFHRFKVVLVHFPSLVTHYHRLSCDETRFIWVYSSGHRWRLHLVIVQLLTASWGETGRHNAMGREHQSGLTKLAGLADSLSRWPLHLTIHYGFIHSWGKTTECLFISPNRYWSSTWALKKQSILKL